MTKISIISTTVLASRPYRSFNGYGGLERITATLAEELAKRDHEVTLIGAQGSIAEGCKVVELPLGMPEDQALQKYKDALIGQDIIQDHSWTHFPAMLFINELPRYQESRLQICHHGVLGDIQTAPPIEHANWTAFSAAQATYIASTLNIETRVAYHGVDTDLFPLNTNNDGYFLVLGRLSPEKGVLQIVRMMKRLKKRTVVVADDRFIAQPDYARQVLSECDGDIVRFVSGTNMSLDQQLQWMGNAKAMIHCPMAPWLEIFGLAVAEMQTMGKPVLTLMNGAMPEIVEHGVTGFLAGTPDGLIEYMDRLKEIDPNKCRQRMIDKFSLKTMADGHERLFSEIMEGREW